MESTAPQNQAIASVCPLDCPDRCTLNVIVSDGRVVRLDGNHVNPFTCGFICAKVRRFDRRIYGPDRILHPHRRRGRKGDGKFAPISWEDAIAEIAQRLRQIVSESGGESILPYHYGGSNGLLTDGSRDSYFFRRLGASRIARTLCAASTSAAMDALYGRMPGTAFEDYPEARFILIWGANPTHSNIHLVPYLKEAKRRGARIATVDPTRILGGDIVDLSLQIHPGTDVVLALAMICYWQEQGLVATRFLERHATGWRRLLDYARQFPLDRAAALTRVSADSIARLAEEYAQVSPAVVRCGWGLERNRNGLAAVAAVLALPAVAGKFGVRGGGYTLSNSGACRVDETRLAGVESASTRVLNMNHLGRFLLSPLDPPVRALFVYNCNPAATAPDHNAVIRGLSSEDLFTVVHEQVWTDTAQYADIVLPATTFLEHAELSRSYGSYGLFYSEPAISPVGEAKPNPEVFQLLCRAMGWADEVSSESDEEFMRRAIASIGGPLAQGTAVENRLRSDGWVPMDFPGPAPVQFGNVFPSTPDGKVVLYPQALGEEPYRYLADPATKECPLALISPAGSRTISSTLGEFNLLDVRLDINPEDADPRGIRDGDEVRIYNALGEVCCCAHIEERLLPGVVSLPKGMWRRATLNGAIGNSLVPDDVTHVSGGACFNDARVEVERLYPRIPGE